MKQFLSIIAAGLVTYFLWEKWLRNVILPSETSETAGTGGANETSGAGGTGGASGAGGAGGSSGNDYATLAAAIQALANGTQLPNILSVVKTLIVGTTEIVAAESGKRVCVLAYAITGAGTITGKWRTGSSTNNLWEIDLNSPAGNSGANLSTAWPGFLFATGNGDALNFNSDGVGTLAVTYWMENV